MPPARTRGSGLGDGAPSATAPAAAITVRLAANPSDVMRRGVNRCVGTVGSW